MIERTTNWYERKGRTCRRHLGFRRLKDTVEVSRRCFYRVDEFNRRGWHVLVVTFNLKTAFNMNMKERMGSK